jgi:hypothetical protein
MSSKDQKTNPSRETVSLTYFAQPGRRAAQPGGVGRGVARVHVDGMTCNKCINYIQAMPYNPQQYMFKFKNIKRIVSSSR